MFSVGNCESSNSITTSLWTFSFYCYVNILPKNQDISINKINTRNRLTIRSKTNRQLNKLTFLLYWDCYLRFCELFLWLFALEKHQLIDCNIFSCLDKCCNAVFASKKEGRKNYHSMCVRKRGIWLLPVM